MDEAEDGRRLKRLGKVSRMLIALGARWLLLMSGRKGIGVSMLFPAAITLGFRVLCLEVVQLLKPHSDAAGQAFNSVTVKVAHERH